MKKTLVIIVCAFLAVSTSAQRARSSSSSFFSAERSDAPVTFGITTGLNFANMAIEDEGVSISPDSRTGFNIGHTVDLPLMESLYIKSGLLYSTKGFKYEHGSTTETASPAYLEIPILASYRFSTNESMQFQVNFGPYLAYGIGGKWKYEKKGSTIETDFFSSENETNNFDAGLQLGAGVVFSNNYYIGAAYQWGMANVSKEDDYTFKNKNFMINIGYIF